jgi:hypothetical protein
MIGPVMGRQNPPDDVLVDLNAESFGQLLRNPRESGAWIALLKFHDGSNQSRSRPFGAGLVVPRINSLTLSLTVALPTYPSCCRTCD